MPLGLSDITLSVPDAVATLQRVGLLKSDTKQATSGVLSPRPCRLVTDSRLVTQGDIFLAFKGTTHDAHDALPAVISKKPSLIIAEDAHKVPAGISCPVVIVSQARKAWSFLCSAATGNPQDQLTLIGVTGTNGKTSTVWHLRHLFAQIGIPVLSIGTLGAWIGDEFFPTTHTTPDPPVLFSLFKQAVEKGICLVVMEVSSHAIYQEKVSPLRYAAGVFTSFSRDHLDLHGDMKSYLHEKMRLFGELSAPNMRCYASASLGVTLAEFKYAKPDAHIYGFGAEAKAKQFGFVTHTDVSLTGTSPHGSACIVTQGKQAAMPMHVPVVGGFAIENLLAASLVVSDIAAKTLDDFVYKKLVQVPGRLELVPPVAEHHPLSIVDYAHTPDALSKAIEVLRPLTRGQLWVVFGCGGDRDRGKRPLMGQIAASLADRVIFTSDNPRFEDPKQIIDDIIKGVDAHLLQKVETIPDRLEAIRFALKNTAHSDVLLVAGKGAEDYMDIKGQKNPFDDRKSLMSIMRGEHL